MAGKAFQRIGERIKAMPWHKRFWLYFSVRMMILKAIYFNRLKRKFPPLNRKR